MTTFNKILIFVFIALLVILGYEFINSRTKRNKISNKNTFIQNDIYPTTSINRCLVTEISNQAIDPNILWSLGQFKKGILISSIIHNKLQGVLTEIDKTGGIHQGFRWSVKLGIKNDKNEINFVGLDEAGIKKIEVFKKSGNKEIPIFFDDIKNGDKIILYETIDLLKRATNPDADNALEIKIIVL